MGGVGGMLEPVSVLLVHLSIPWYMYDGFQQAIAQWAYHWGQMFKC